MGDEMGWLIWMAVMGVLLLSTGAALMLTDALDGLGLALAGTGFSILCTVLAVVGAMGMSAARGRDLNGRYAGSPLKDWFDHLASGKGRCCSDADGYAVSDVDWESKDGHYRVRLPNKSKPGDPAEWVDVPDDALVTEPNRAGRAMVWPIYGVPRMQIRCFMPGSMT